MVQGLGGPQHQPLPAVGRTPNLSPPLTPDQAPAQAGVLALFSPWMWLAEVSKCRWS